MGLFIVSLSDRSNIYMRIGDENVHLKRNDQGDPVNYHWLLCHFCELIGNLWFYAVYIELKWNLCDSTCNYLNGIDTIGRITKIEHNNIHALYNMFEVAIRYCSFVL